jgi:hypothetical protein
MTLAAPDWLTKRGGELLPAPDGRSRLLMFNGTPQYKLTPGPAAGRYECIVMQTVNGKRLDKGATYPTAADAIRGGLEELRGVLGW